jgi:NhaP-type Na+/H+ or K+/H+ antiporter
MATSGLPIFEVLGLSLLVGYVARWLSLHFRVSEVGTLLVAGLLAGPLLGLLSPTVPQPALLVVGPLALVIVLFEGGLHLSFRDLRAHSGQGLRVALSCWLASVCVGLLVGPPLLHLDFARSLLLGFVLATMGILVVIPLVAALGVPPSVRIALTLEAAVADLLSTVGVTALAGILVRGAAPSIAAALLGQNLVVGIACGVLAGFVWMLALQGLKFERHAYGITLGALVLLYVATQTLGGSGLLAALAFGVVLGNAEILRREGGIRLGAGLQPESRAYQNELIFILKAFYFFAIGVSIPRGDFSEGLLLAAAATVVLLAAGRAVATEVGFGRRRPNEARNARSLVRAIMPRGLATVLLATIPVGLGVSGTSAFPAFALVVLLGADMATTAGVWLVTRHGAEGPAVSSLPPVPQGRQP